MYNIVAYTMYSLLAAMYTYSYLCSISDQWQPLLVFDFQLDTTFS